LIEYQVRKISFRPNTTMKTGTDSISANCAAPPLTTCAARMATLPVMWAVNRPPSPRKLMTSTLPAIRLEHSRQPLRAERTVDRGR